MFRYVPFNSLLFFILLSFMAKLPYSQLVMQQKSLWQTCLQQRCLQGSHLEPSEQDAHIKLVVPQASPNQTSQTESILCNLVLPPTLFL